MKQTRHNMISQNQEENCRHHTNLITEDERKLDLTTAANIREETGQCSVSVIYFPLSGHTLQIFD